MLVAVIVTTAAVLGAVNITVLPDVLVVGKKLPPGDDVQFTPRFPVSLVSVAFTWSVCEVVSPPRFGVTLTVILVPPDAEVVAVVVFE